MELMNSIPWFAWIAIVAIVGGALSNTITSVAKMTYRHRERMAMIQMGLHPDGEPGLSRDTSGKPAAYEEV
jgi:hypothetical protein